MEIGVNSSLRARRIEMGWLTGSTRVGCNAASGPMLQQRPDAASPQFNAPNAKQSTGKLTAKPLRSSLRTWALRAGTAALMLSTVQLSPARAADVETVLLCEHTSDVLRGPPLNDRDERQQDYCGAGVTISVGSHRAWELDLTHGLKSIDRERRESGTQLAVRFYPGRLRRN